MLLLAYVINKQNQQMTVQKFHTTCADSKDFFVNHLLKVQKLTGCTVENKGNYFLIIAASFKDVEIPKKVIRDIGIYF